MKKPSLGTIPLFMAGDKQFFYHANRVSTGNELPLVFLSENPFERTDFKSGFCGIAPSFGKKNHIYSLSTLSKLKMIFFYSGHFATNPGYLNSSLVDSFAAFVSYYFIPHNYINIFGYIPFDESRVDSTLINEYDWEISTDTPTTWRIGDGTAAFYNYIYYTVAGFSENETFRSNQIREGVIDRETALKKAFDENNARYESIRWYLDTIDLDFTQTIRTINAIPKMYPA
ncbi:MAG: hypothetical protein FJX95_09310 [Bacteroidetes bacterium]|nr:hypothetical protein [Bacteroidota bacterium]